MSNEKVGANNLKVFKNPVSCVYVCEHVPKRQSEGTNISTLLPVIVVVIVISFPL